MLFTERNSARPPSLWGRQSCRPQGRPISHRWGLSRQYCISPAILRAPRHRDCGCVSIPPRRWSTRCHRPGGRFRLSVRALRLPLSASPSWRQMRIAGCYSCSRFPERCLPHQKTGWRLLARQRTTAICTPVAPALVPHSRGGVLHSMRSPFPEPTGTLLSPEGLANL